MAWQLELPLVFEVETLTTVVDGVRYQLRYDERDCAGCAFFHRDCGHIPDTEECLMHSKHVWKEIK